MTLPKRMKVWSWIACLLFHFGSSVAAQDTSPSDARAEQDQHRFDEFVELLRTRNAATYKPQGPWAIDEGRYVTLGGTEQWVTIRGEDRANPVLLLLHGGPGDATNPWSYAVLAPWLSQFTIVQWDQRGSGRSLRKSGTGIADTITLKRMVSDGIELAEYLRRTMHTEKIIIVGHSWGSVLGALIAQARPDLLCALVGTGQVVDNTRNYQVAYRNLLEKARATGEKRALEELRSVGPPPPSDRTGPEVDRQWEVQHKWSNSFEHADEFLTMTLGYALVAPSSSPGDLVDWFEGQGISGKRLVPETRDINLMTRVPKLSVPVFIIQGAEDFTTPGELAKRYVAELQAPAKTYVQIEGAGHFAMFMKPREFLSELVTRVRPLALRGAPPPPTAH
jgi:pimeloyl-ACP methyl ester carboxylesterase